MLRLKFDISTGISSFSRLLNVPESLGAEGFYKIGGWTVDILDTISIIKLTQLLIVMTLHAYSKIDAHSNLTCFELFVFPVSSCQLVYEFMNLVHDVSQKQYAE